jgi:hypothetical protein
VASPAGKGPVKAVVILPVCGVLQAFKAGTWQKIIALPKG